MLKIICEPFPVPNKETHEPVEACMYLGLNSNRLKYEQSLKKEFQPHSIYFNSTLFNTELDREEKLLIGMYNNNPFSSVYGDCRVWRNHTIESIRKDPVTGLYYIPFHGIIKIICP